MRAAICSALFLCRYTIKPCINITFQVKLRVMIFKFFIKERGIKFGNFSSAGNKWTILR